MRLSTPRRGSTSRTSPPTSRRSVSRARSFRAGKSRAAARRSARGAHRSIPSARPWCRPRAPARPTTSTRGPCERGVSAKDTAGDPGAALLAASCPVPAGEGETILLAHGGGGRMTQRLIENVFLKSFDNPALRELHDGAVFDVGGARLAFSTDSFVVSPLFFPGGDIGSLAVHGTVNDLAMCGAQPLALSAGLILEATMRERSLSKIVASLQAAAAGAGVPIVTGDTKVVDRGKGDGVFINVSGVGLARHDH